MLSLAGRRPGARLYAREDKPSHRSKTTSPSYLRPLHRSYRVEALGPDSIKPLVELGFWSKSVEVRRDSAAALSTLARNPDNLGTLGRSGALGATLSLLISTDDACVRDATLTLGQLVQCVELADRFMERTGGSGGAGPAAVARATARAGGGREFGVSAGRGRRDRRTGRAPAARRALARAAATFETRRRASSRLARRARDRTALGADGAVVGRCSPCSRHGPRGGRRGRSRRVRRRARGRAGHRPLVEHGGVTTLCTMRDRTRRRDGRQMLSAWPLQRRRRARGACGLRRARRSRGLRICELPAVTG